MLEQIGPFLLLLGPLVVFHELGHFLVAKYFNVKCLRFSVGFGPVLLRYRLGETEYALSALPLGGYVKMLGENEEDDIPEEDRQRSFLGQSPLRRTLIAVAGPGMNVLLAVAIYATVLMTIGVPYRTPEIGAIVPGGAAEEAGIRVGDLVLEIDGTKVTRFAEMAQVVRNSEGRPMRFLVQRGGERVELDVAARADDSGTWLIGAQHEVPVPLLVFPQKDAEGLAAGLRNGDVVVAVNGEPTKSDYHLTYQLDAASGPLEIEVERQLGEQSERVVLTLGDSPTDLWSRKRLGAVPVGFAVLDAIFTRPAHTAGLKKGDIPLSINGRPVMSLETVMTMIRESNGAPLAIEVWRLEGTRTIEVTPEEWRGPKGEEEARWAIGVVLSQLTREGEILFDRESNALSALVSGTVLTWQTFRDTVEGIASLVTGKVDANSIAGPIGIGQIANETYDRGLRYFLQLMAFISVNLAIINLLPIPVLDGGHIVFAGAEAVSGGPIGPRVRERAQVIGLLAVVALMGFAFWNDLSRFNWSEIVSGWFRM